MDLSDAIAVVFGGASGLGEGAVRALVAAGVDCVVADVDEDRGRALAGELAPHVSFERVDITNADEVEGVFAAERPTPVRFVVSCAFVPGGSRRVRRAGRPHLRELVPQRHDDPSRRRRPFGNPPALANVNPG